MTEPGRATSRGAGPDGGQASDKVQIAAAFKGADGKPRFHMRLPRAALKDPGVGMLAFEEVRRGGFEYPTRRFFDEHLRPGDLFIDVGAHWGIYALHAATRHPGEVDVLALEPHPVNVEQLLMMVRLNQLSDRIEVISTAVGDHAGTAPLVMNSTMGNSLHGFGLPAGARTDLRMTVPVMPLDAILAERPALDGRRVLMKVDVEGFEPEAIDGAAALLDSGRVAALVWEYGRGFFAGERRDRALAMVEILEARGFRQFRFPHTCMGGPLIPFAPTFESGNVFALAPDFEANRVYPKPDPKPEPLPRPCRSSDAPETRTAVTEILLRHRATDGARWADFEGQVAGAQDRAVLAAAHITAGSHVLDLRAGTMALRACLPDGCRYQAADLLPFTPETMVVDLNQDQFPDGHWDVAVMLDVIEFLHDPAAVLRRCRTAADRLVLTYHPAEGGDSDARRAVGWFHDHRPDDFREIVESAGWTIDSEAQHGARRLFLCAAA